MEEGGYEDGKKHGMWITYYANGSKRSEGAYRRGVKEGPWVQYWPNGARKAEMRFVDGKYLGVYTAYHENGKRAMQGRYNEGVGGSADGTKEGAFHYYNEDGETVWRIITYHRGSRTKPDEHPNPRTTRDD